MPRRKKRNWEAEMRYEQQSYYDDHNTTQIKLKLNNKTDKNVLDWLYEKKRWNSHTSMQGEIKKLIRERIELEKGA